MQDSTKRFSSRVENYIKYRPTYPWGVIETLHARCGLTPSAVIADIGSGTGMLSELFLRYGNQVYGVEPNREMREAGERLLANYPHFHNLEGTAEATTLAEQSVDFVSAGQAFHWFDQARAHREFLRILRPGGWVVLVWNYRRLGTPVMDAYEQLLHTYSAEYPSVSHQRPDMDDDALHAFFAPAGCQVATHANQQRFDFAGLKGRLLSSSYAPEAGHPQHEPMLAALQTLFNTYQVAGQVTFAYDTKVYYGQLAANK